MLQQTTPTTHLSVSEAEALNPDFPLILEAMRVSAAGANQQAASVTVPRDCLTALADTTRAVIVVSLPNNASLDVAKTLEGRLQVFNHHSTDLLTARTLLSIGDKGNELWLDSCHMPDALDYDAKTFVIVVTCGDSVWRKRFVPEDFEDFVLDLSCHESCSGLNYKPYRIWNDAELEQAALLAKEEPPRTPPLMPLALHFGMR